MGNIDKKHQLWSAKSKTSDLSNFTLFLKKLEHQKEIFPSLFFCVAFPGNDSLQNMILRRLAKEGRGVEDSIPPARLK